MTEAVLSIFVKLLSFQAANRRETSLTIEKNSAFNFLSKHFSKEAAPLFSQLFLSYYKEFQNKIDSNEIDELLLNLEKEVKDLICKIPLDRRLYIVANLMEVSLIIQPFLVDEETIRRDTENLLKISDWFNLSDSFFQRLQMFIKGDYHLIDNSDDLLIVTSQNQTQSSRINFFEIFGFIGTLYVLNFRTDIFLIKYHGKNNYYLDGKILLYDVSYVFTSTSEISGNNFSSIYFSDLNKALNSNKQNKKTTLTINKLKFNFKSGKTGLHPLSFTTESNEMVGVIGGSGTGKTTLLNLLIGELQPLSGQVYVNGKDIKDWQNLHELIGYIPQDDILIEELSVFDNLYFSTKLSLGIKNKRDIIAKCDKALKNFGLESIKNLKVGSPIKKIISGGQRKRLNLALDIIREPSILFVDEPTSGLSSSDSRRVVRILKNHALKGNIVMVNIHQPSDDLFYMFDKILILDKGGYPIYEGRPSDALNYFYSLSKKIKYENSLKRKTEAEEVLSIIEEVIVDEYGNDLEKRIIEPEEYHQLYQEKVSIGNTISNNANSATVEKTSNSPVFFYQFITFFKRQIKARISSKPFLTMAFLAAPLLALILAGLSKEMQFVNGENKYIFALNSNIPAFYFMSTLVAMFLGLIISAQEIYGDRHIKKREKFLNINQTVYYLSKICYLIIVSIVQSGLFVIVSTIILKLSGNLLVFWITLFLLFVLANILGLIISGVFKSTAAIYIAIPILLIPQILLSGVVVKYQNLHPMFSSKENVPPLGNAIPIRWSYEALIVNEFINNEFQNSLYQGEKDESRLSFVVFTKIPYLLKQIETIRHIGNTNVKLHESFGKLLKNELPKLKSYNAIDFPENLNYKNLTDPLIKKVENYLISSQNILIPEFNRIEKSNEHVFERLKSRFTNTEEFQSYKNKHFNEETAKVVLNRNALNTFKIVENKILPVKEIIYIQPENKFGGTPLYAFQKRLFNRFLPTIFFNNLIIIAISIFLSFILIKELHLKSGKFFK